MTTKILWPWELPKTIDGVAVVCDVWGATTNITTLLNNGTAKLFIVNNRTVLETKRDFPNALVIGESDAFSKDFFHTSNLTSHVAKADVKNKTVLFMSNNGSKTIELAFSKKAKQIVTVSYSNIQSVCSFLKNINEIIFLIPSGDKNAKDFKALEDLLCVEALRNLLENVPVDFEKVHETARKYIHDIYGYQKFDEGAAFPIVFDKVNLPIVPMCEMKRGIIQVSNALDY